MYHAKCVDEESRAEAEEVTMSGEVTPDDICAGCGEKLQTDEEEGETTEVNEEGV
jgi:hypothetical protein